MRRAAWFFTLVLLFAVLPSAAGELVTPTQLDVEVSLEPGDEAGIFECQALIRDAQTGELLSAPRVIFAQGEDGKATVTTGLDDGGMVRLTVQVDEDGSRAHYRSEVLRGDEVVTAQSASIRLR